MRVLRPRFVALTVVMVACAVSVTETSTQSAQDAPVSELWIHVKASGARAGMDLNMPLVLVETALAMASDTVVDQGQLQLGDRYGLPVSTIRDLWLKLRGAADAEFVTVSHGSRQVRITRSDDMILVSVLNERASEAVRAEVPASVVDALLSGDGDLLDIRAALEELSTLAGEVVRVVEPDSNIQIWIDDSPVQ